MSGSIMARGVGEWRVPALGIGTWALGGDWEFEGRYAARTTKVVLHRDRITNRT